MNRDVLPSGWREIQINGIPLWRHTSGAQVYQSSMWEEAEEERKQGVGFKGWEKEIPTWKAQRVDDVPYHDDDGCLYMTREEAMAGALQPNPYAEVS
jgi:hypothetical protein